MEDMLICKMLDCKGTLDKDNVISLQTGCMSTSPCYACSKCGRIHSASGELMFNRPGAAVFWENYGLKLVMEEKVFEVDKFYKTSEHVQVCLDAEGDCTFTDMVTLEPNSRILYYGMDDVTFIFCNSEDGTKYRLHRGDVNYIVAE